MKKAINQNFRLSTTYKILCLYFICSADIKAQYSPNDSVTSKNLNELLLIAQPKKEFFCRIEDKLISRPSKSHFSRNGNFLEMDIAFVQLNRL
jgi:hypothetical protein